ncbi:SLATT domain-containing protein [Roseovarius tolerans]|uniref:SLATT domain-containing protein n=1 Tax=Roseovarius tolerans TaxID=74031 RepID=UPI0034DB38A1
MPVGGPLQWGHSNRRKFWFGFSVLLYIVAAVLLLSEELDGPDLTWGFSFLLVVVTSSFGWIQVKRHGELAASYTLTAHEIGSIQTLALEISDETKLSEFVNAAEFAFSREHTQWQARRDFG